MDISTLVLIVMSLWVLPAAAVTGQLDGGIQVKQVICVNSTQSATSIASVQGTTFDCGNFSATPGDQITIVLVGTGDESGPCNTVQEQESNDAQPGQDVGTLQAGACITVVGNTDTGYSDRDNPDPNTDRDRYVFSLDGVSLLRIEWGFPGEILLGVLDANTGELLEPRLPGGRVVEADIPAQTNRVSFVMSTKTPLNYAITFFGLAGTGTQLLGATTYGTQIFLEETP